MRRIAISLVVLGLLAAACGDDRDSSDSGSSVSGSSVSGSSTTVAEGTTTAPATTSEPTTTTTTSEAPPTLTAADLASTGPYPVGVTTRELATGNLVEIWYPAGSDAVGQTDTYAVRDFTPDVLRTLVPEETNDRVTVAAGRDAGAAGDGPFPVVLFSHGSSSFRLQSTNLAHHLASWGMIVASPGHPSRALVNFLGAPEDPPYSVDDMLGALEIVTNDDVLGPAADPTRVGVSGHSAGGGTTLGVATSIEVAGYMSLASGAFESEALPDVPSLFMAGELDTIVEPSSTRAAFDLASSPSWYLEFAASGHLVFSDLCAVGNGDATLIGLGDAAGVGDLLNDNIRRLGTDGCEEPNRTVTEVWPGIHQAATGFFRYIFAIDPEPLGLDAAAVDGVEADSK